MKYLLIILSLMLLGFVLLAQEDVNHRPWDLSYESLLEINGVKWDHSQGTLFTWLKDRDQEHNMITGFIQGEMRKQPIAAFLIDHPTFPSGGRTTIFGIKNGAGCIYYWRSTDQDMNNFKRKSMSAEMFDQIFNRLRFLKQRGYENMGGPEKAYAGFLSTYQKGYSRQLLLHIHDFLEFDVENQEILREGRIFEIENSLQVDNQ